eukprot:TRINITY_DN12614_c0_g3_i2.p1 TRINITY_DN12614_c0_g3~~TRINITY_DN12614_c0_g3_i2.p1  ORF type:complete len:328 (+),score=8.08 TRINITY_DN12614_c0_g3_i2:96-1079(+)
MDLHMDSVWLAIVAMAAGVCSIGCCLVGLLASRSVVLIIWTTALGAGSLGLSVCLYCGLQLATHMDALLAAGTSAIVGASLYVIVFAIRIYICFDPKDTPDDDDKRKDTRYMTRAVFAYWILCAGLFLYTCANLLQPPSPHPEACGLHSPPGHHKVEFYAGANHAKESRSRHHAAPHVQHLHDKHVKLDNHSTKFETNDRWIWVELHGHLPEPVRAGQWEYSPDCFKISKYDIATQSWADGCAKWCQQSFGAFVWNEICALGLQMSEHHKALAVLRVCQQAEVALMFQLSNTASWLVGLSMVLCALLVGAIEYKVRIFPEPKPSIRS